MLSDESSRVSAQYTSIDAVDVPVPSIVLIRNDGKIQFERQSSSKDDRPSIDELLASIDRSLGLSGPFPGAKHGYAVIERLIASARVAGGAIELDDSWRPTASAALAVEYPATRKLLVGASIGGALRESPLDLDATITLRWPFWNETAAWHVEAAAGWSPLATSPLNAGLRTGMWLARSPRWGLALEVGVRARGELPELAATFSVSRLIQVH